MNYDLDTIYLLLKITTLMVTLIAGVSLGLNTLYQIYQNNKDFKQREKKRKAREATDEFQEENKLRLERLGVKEIPEGYYRQDITCYNCYTQVNSFGIKKGTLEEEFRKKNFCYNCGCRLDFKLKIKI